MRAFVLLALSGCSLYFGDPSIEHKLEPDACGGGGTAAPDAHVCPAVGTFAEISDPIDGATDVPSPVAIRWRTHIPNTLDGRGIYLSDDALDQAVPLDHWNSACSIHPDGIDYADKWNVDCYDLEPNKQYTWHIWITCYDASGIHELAKATFRTAP